MIMTLKATILIGSYNGETIKEKLISELEAYTITIWFRDIGGAKSP